jgi:hypothetical protein
MEAAVKKEQVLQETYMSETRNTAKTREIYSQRDNIVVTFTIDGITPWLVTLSPNSTYHVKTKKLGFSIEN